MRRRTGFSRSDSRRARERLVQQVYLKPHASIHCRVFLGDISEWGLTPESLSDVCVSVTDPLWDSLGNVSANIALGIDRKIGYKP
jgi:hypothetical protein